MAPSTHARSHGDQRKNNFDLIRLMAATQVVINHANEWLKLPIPDTLAWLLGLFPGVAVFFVISGFLIVKSFLEKDGDLLPYAVNRAARIYPGLWVNLLIVTIMVLATGALAGRQLAGAQFWLYEAVVFLTGSTFFANLVFGDIHSWGGFFSYFPSGVTWTITVELGFYLLVPLIFLRPVRNNPRLLMASLLTWFALSMAVAVVTQQLRAASPGGNITGIFDTIVLPYLWIFLLGSAAYLGWSGLRPWLFNKAHWWIGLYVGVSWLLWQVGEPSVLDFKVLSVGNALRIVLMGLCVLSIAFTWVGCSRLLRGVDLSYGVYLYHMPIIWTMRALGVTGVAHLWGVVLALVAVAAALSWFLVEAPGLKLKGCASARRRTAVPGGVR